MKFHYVYNLWDDGEAAKLSGVDRLVYRSNKLGSRPAHHQHRRRQHLVEDHGNGSADRRRRSKCFGSKAPAATCGRARAKIFPRSTRPNCSACKKPTPRRGDKGLKSQAEDDMVRHYNHCTFNLNPRAQFHRHAAAQFHSGQARGSHAPERDHRHRGVGELRKVDAGNFRRRNGLRALDASRLRTGPGDAGNLPKEPDARRRS